MLTTTGASPPSPQFHAFGLGLQSHALEEPQPDPELDLQVSAEGVLDPTGHVAAAGLEGEKFDIILTNESNLGILTSMSSPSGSILPITSRLLRVKSSSVTFPPSSVVFLTMGTFMYRNWKRLSEVRKEFSML